MPPKRKTTTEDGDATPRVSGSDSKKAKPDAESSADTISIGSAVPLDLVLRNEDDEEVKLGDLVAKNGCASGF